MTQNALLGAQEQPSARDQVLALESSAAPITAPLKREPLACLSCSNALNQNHGTSGCIPRHSESRQSSVI
jgi:hypothetical protein